MAQHSAKRRLGHRDALRTRLILDLMRGTRLTARDVQATYCQGVSDSSFHKTFKRDRDVLSNEGIHLIEEPMGTAKSWALDRERTLADLSRISDEDARTIAAVLRPLIGDPATLEPGVLGCAAARIGRDVGSTPHTQGPSCSPEILEAITTSLQARRPCELLYRAQADPQAVTRVLHPYGLFELGTSTYVVGLRVRRGVESAIRTLNLSRAESARVLWDEEHYEIPKGFNVHDYRLLPFEIGAEEPVEIRLYVPRAVVAAFREQARQRGRAEMHQGGAMEWTATARDLAEAAAWTVETGALPLGPAALVSSWRSLLGEAEADVQPRGQSGEAEADIQPKGQTGETVPGTQLEDLTGTSEACAHQDTPSANPDAGAPAENAPEKPNSEAERPNSKAHIKNLPGEA